MFSWRRKSREPSGKQSSPEEDNATGGEEPNEDAPEAEDTTITKPISLEELENADTDSDEAQAKSPEEGEDIQTQPVQLEEEPAGDKGENVFLESADDKESDTENEEDGDSISNLFSDDEEEENPLAGLITSLPDVTARELLDEVQEVEAMVRQWHQS